LRPRKFFRRGKGPPVRNILIWLGGGKARVFGKVKKGVKKKTRPPNGRIRGRRGTMPPNLPMEKKKKKGGRGRKRAFRKTRRLKAKPPVVKNKRKLPCFRRRRGGGEEKGFLKRNQKASSNKVAYNAGKGKKKKEKTPVSFLGNYRLPQLEWGPKI